MLAAPSRRRAGPTAVCLLLIAANLAVFAPVLSFDFIHYDDPLYVTTNPYIRDGITGDGVRWVFTHEHGGSWHPLTGLSHMLDCELFGLRPGGHHLTSIVLHTVNSLLLFGLLQAATGATWRSGIVALLFAAHPLHVEPVAWVSGRKDVLSTCFAFLSLWAYIAYGRRGAARRYALALVLFALALMAKPMLVTLPLVFLLLDYWPLGRFVVARGASESDRGGAAQQGDETGGVDEAGDRASAPVRRSPAALVIEKLPLLALAALVSAVTYLGHRSAGTLTGGESISAGQRLANALVSYVRYLGKSVWPVGLTVHYPHPNLPGGVPWAWWQVAAAAALLLLVSLWVLRQRHDRPYALVGWLWYLVTLVPVLGLVQVGRHAMADRYTYVPLVGVTIALVWGAAAVGRRLGLSGERGRQPLPPGELGGRTSHANPWRPVLGGLAVVTVALLAARAASQVRYWRDTATLLEHALAVAPDAPEMHWTLGRELREQGRVDEAIEHFRRAVAIRPEYPDADIDLGVALWTQGRTDEAVSHYERALRAAPENAGGHNALGMALQAQGNVAVAIEHYREAVRLRPGYPEAHTNLGTALHGTGQLDEAALHYGEALRLDPQRVEARINLAHLLAASGKLDEAILLYRTALEMAGDNAAVHLALARALQASERHADAIAHLQRAQALGADGAEVHSGLGLTLYHQGKIADAIAHYQQALATRPGDAVTHNRLGRALYAVGRTEEAIGQFRRAVQIQPAFANAHRNLAVALESQGKVEEARGHYAQAGAGGSQPADVARDVAPVPAE
jgi:tetratricopeptide (TPR) repeat protein